MPKLTAKNVASTIIEYCAAGGDEQNDAEEFFEYCLKESRKSYAYAPKCCIDLIKKLIKQELAKELPS